TQGSQVAYLLIYVDDIILTTSSSVLLQQIIDSLHKEFDMTNLGALNYFLSIADVRHSTGLLMSQKKYALQLLERAHMVNCNPSRTLVDTDPKLGPDGVPVQDSTLYRSLAGGLQEPHFAALKRILRYVQGTLDLGLHLYASATTSLVGYTDADWAGCPSTHRSTSGYCVFLDDNLLSCAVYMSANPVQHQRTKHIEIHFVHDMVKAGHVRILPVPSRFQYADIFTKGLPSALFEDFRSSLSVRPPPAQTTGIWMGVGKGRGIQDVKMTKNQDINGRRKAAAKYPKHPLNLVEGTTSTTLTSRLPILNPVEYDLWLMRIEQYFLMTDYSLWEVILNGNKVLKRTVGETEQEYEPTTAEEKQDRRNEMKAIGTLLMALTNKDQLKFHSYKDAKLLMESIEKRYRGNKESKKVQITLLKQQYENFTGSSSKTMDQTFDSTNNNCNSNTNEADNTTYGVSAAHTQCNPTSGDNLSDAMICAFLASQPNSSQLAREDLEQINLDDLEEMDLQCEMAMLTIRARRFIQRTSRKLDVNAQRVEFDRTKVECYNCHKNGHFARECRAPRNQENRGRENKRTVTVETPTENALVAQDGIGGYNWSYQAEEEHPTNIALLAHTSSRSSSSSDSEVDSCSKSCVKAYATLKEQYDSLSSNYKKS
ncbi:ribonuclease H-like domain-containing protein, partial [Tanacetum coccineum]